MDTIKGKGVPELEVNPGNHSLTLPEAEWERYLNELKRELTERERGL